MGGKNRILVFRSAIGDALTSLVIVYPRGTSSVKPQDPVVGPGDGGVPRRFSPWDVVLKGLVPSTLFWVEHTRYDGWQLCN